MTTTEIECRKTIIEAAFTHLFNNGGSMKIYASANYLCRQIKWQPTWRTA
jgi:hypothetical protein